MRYCPRLPTVTACSTPLITMDTTQAHKDTRCPYSKIKLTKLSVDNLLDKLPPPQFIKYDFFLYINIYTYTILRIYM